MKICVAGEGAFGNKHLDAIARITDIEVVALAGGVAEDTAGGASFACGKTCIGGNTYGG